MNGESKSAAIIAWRQWREPRTELLLVSPSLGTQLCRKKKLLRRGPLSTAIPRASAGGLKPEIIAQVQKTRPGCHRTEVVKAGGFWELPNKPKTFFTQPLA
jgi:hypothetical protein